MYMIIYIDILYRWRTTIMSCIHNDNRVSINNATRISAVSEAVVVVVVVVIMMIMML